MSYLNHNCGSFGFDVTERSVRIVGAVAIGNVAEWFLCVYEHNFQRHLQLPQLIQDT